MLKKALLSACLVCLFGFISPLFAGIDEGIFTGEYSLRFLSDYPPRVGEKVTLSLQTFKAAQKVTLFSDREEEIPLRFVNGYWQGDWQIPADYKSGGHFFTVWIRYPFSQAKKAYDFWADWLISSGLSRKQSKAFWSESRVWYQMEKTPATVEAEFRPTFIPGPTYEAEEPLPISTGEAVSISIPSVEVAPFIIKGAKTLSFASKSIEGTKEGYVPGVTREEALRLNISGQSDDTEVDANLISTSTAGTTQVAQREEKISVLLRRGSTEAYLGDYTADLTETEFAGLTKVLSGVRLKGDYGNWGVNLLYSSPKGESKFKRLYGDNTQGPYRLDFAPVVINSEKIYLDGVLQKRGDDYTVDYQAGTISFIRKTIDSKSVLNIYYDYRQTVLPHATYGLRATNKYSPNLKVGATYLNDSDSTAGAAEAKVSPQGHYLIGVDESFVSDSLTLNSEAAYSLKSFNLLTAGSDEAGRAIRLDLGSQLGPFGLTARGKRVGPKFRSIADPSPKQDVSEYGAGLSFRPSPLFGSQVKYDYEKYALGEAYYENRLQNAKLGLTPERFPSIEYQLSELEESNDPVTGSRIARRKTRQSAESQYRLGALSTTLKSVSEKWLRTAPSEETTNYERVNFGLATVGLERAAFSANAEMENRREPDGTAPDKKSLNLNLSLSPSRAYFASAALEYIDDSAQGPKNTTDISYRAEPVEMLKTDGKYVVTTVREEFGTTETVVKTTGSFSFDLKPVNALRLRYQLKPNFTRILRTDAVGFSNEQQQIEINLLPVREIMLGTIYRLGRSYRVLSANHARRDNSADTDSTLYTVKLAPFQIFSTEFNYLLETGRTTAFVTAEPLAYTPGQSFGKKLDAIIKTSLTERLAVDSRYTYQRGTQGTGEAQTNLADSVSHTAAVKGIWNVTDLFSLSLSTAYSKIINNLAAEPLAYTVTPGLGFIYREGERLRVDGDYTQTRATTGTANEKSNLSLRTKYGVSDYVNVTLRLEQEISRSPDYKLTDISGNIEINL